MTSQGFLGWNVFPQQKSWEGNEKNNQICGANFDLFRGFQAPRPPKSQHLFQIFWILGFTSRTPDAKTSSPR